MKQRLYSMSLKMLYISLLPLRKINMYKFLTICIFLLTLCFQASNLCVEGLCKEVLHFHLCAIIWKAHFINTWGCITLETFQTYFSMSHLSQSTHNSALIWMVWASDYWSWNWMVWASVYWSWYPVCQCVQKQWVAFLFVSLVSILVHPLQKSSKKSVWNFFP